MSGEAVSAFQRECIDVFVRGAQALGVPRSVGEIYGLLFSTEEPLPMEAIMKKLAISKGSASQGLKWLRETGAVRPVYMPGDRRDHFVAEIELRKLAAGFLRERVQPRLDGGGGLLARLEDADGSTSKFALSRIKKLRRWHRFGGQVLPLLLRVAERF